MLIGKQTWEFESKPVIISSSAVGGPFEFNSPLAKDFDYFFEDIWMGQKSFEQAERKLLEKACDIVIQKGQKNKEDIQLFISGDLMNQIIPSSFAARTLESPYLGIFGACSSSAEGMALASLIVNNKYADYVIAATSSHNAAAEKQFRYPTEYGAQKPPTAQWTTTGAGAVLIAQEGEGPKVTNATIGKVIDMGVSDPFNMGVAMAPAAIDTIHAHFTDLNRNPRYYDLIITGDLGKTGHKVAKDLLKKNGFDMPEEIFIDCGAIIYKEEQSALSGASGCACAAVTTYGHLFNRMRNGEINKILLIATGALLSPISYQQKESIPSIAHAVSIEM